MKENDFYTLNLDFKEFFEWLDTSEYEFEWVNEGSKIPYCDFVKYLPQNLIDRTVNAFNNRKK